MYYSRSKSWNCKNREHDLSVHGIAVAMFITVLFCAVMLANMTMPAQRILSAILFAAALLLGLKRHSENIRLLLIFLSIISTVRYIVWRMCYTLSMTTFVETTISILLFLAECYSAYTLVAFYFQTLDLDRDANGVKPDPFFTPSVDVLISTLNEPVDIMRRTASGALSIDYPNKKVYILDDGRREEMRQLAKELGCGYFTRPNNKNAKAGNVNNALPQTDGEFILFLDADQIPFRTILKRTISAFKDPLVVLMQSAHRCLNPGPVERNLYLDGILPNEQELFFQLVQVGNNFWNAAFFCGSAAIIRRSALMEVGGMATETVTEDCHTSMRLHAKGWKSKYYSRPLSVGLSPESLSGWVIQHCRWARGVTQMLCVQNPIWLKGLTWAQKYCYFNGMVHFWFGIPRLIFYLAPVSFLIFGIHPVRVAFVDYLAMAIPYILIASWSNSYIFRNYRHSYWADVYEALLAAPYALTVLWAVVDPKTGKFNVTPKGTTINKTYLDWISAPNVVLLTLLLVSIGFGINRLVCSSCVRETYATAINLTWAFYNIFTIVPAILCAIEHAFVKRTHPVKRKFSVELFSADRKVEYATTQTITEYSSVLKLDKESPLEPIRVGDSMRLILHTDSERYPEIALNAKISYLEFTPQHESLIGVDFTSQDANTMRALIEAIYCEESFWATLHEPEDAFIPAFSNLVTTPWRVFVHTKRWLYQDRLTMLASKLKEKPVLQRSQAIITSNS